jgi:carbon-monoxide dehydrogenase medium subunit
MFPEEFDYFRPKSVDEAVGLMKKYGENARVLAGGMSLIPLLKSRVISIPNIVDMSRIPELSNIEERRGEITIGSMVTDYQIENSKVLYEKIPLLKKVSAWIGDPQVRNRGTMGGSLCHADPSGDWGACFLALRGKVTVLGEKGKRTIESDDFFEDSYTTAMKPGEVMTEITFPIPEKNSGYSYQKMERKAGDFATVGVAVQLSISGNGECTYAGIGMTAVAPTPIRSQNAEQFLMGKKVDRDTIREAAKIAADETNPMDDPLRGSAEFKRYISEVLVRRGLNEALEKAREVE